jgi:hypothetical protein
VFDFLQEVNAEIYGGFLNERKIANAFIEQWLRASLEQSFSAVRDASLEMGRFPG